MTEAEQNAEPIRYPRWLATLSWACGFAIPVAIVGTASGLADTVFGERVVAGFLLVTVNVGYFAAPLLAGRNAVSSFLAALVLLVSVAGWTSLFVPDALDSTAPGFPWIALLAAASLVALAGGAVVVFRHFRRLYR
ncbi:MAG: hypothetical protein RLO50_21665 [Azospirillaceae bacterium]